MEKDAEKYNIKGAVCSSASYRHYDSQIGLTSSLNTLFTKSSVKIFSKHQKVFLEHEKSPLTKEDVESILKVCNFSFQSKTTLEFNQR